MKTIMATIEQNEKTFVGQRLLFEHRGGTTIGTIIGVTRDRVFYINEKGDEEWAWISPNGKQASFSVLKTNFNEKFIKALELKESYKLLKKENDYLKSQLEEIKIYKKVIKILKNENFNDY